MFTLSDAVLNRLFEVNRFPVPRDEMGFRHIDQHVSQHQPNRQTG